ncbi:Protein of unknown function [Gryllus bimaculatus]|nr:Protein of unknown function [Gryllus bimaculatus]
MTKRKDDPVAKDCASKTVKDLLTSQQLQDVPKPSDNSLSMIQILPNHMFYQSISFDEAFHKSLLQKKFEKFEDNGILFKKSTQMFYK